MGEASGGIRSPGRRAIASFSLAAALLLAPALPARADDFEADLARVDRALAKNPTHVPAHNLESCRSRRNNAVLLHDAGYRTRAERSLKYCFQVLGIPEERAEPVQVTVRTIEQMQAEAAREVERALSLAPDAARGLRIYRECAPCHTPEGWGLPGGTVPQIAGQHREVVIKQLADIRAGNRDNLVMVPYASVESIGGVQAVADVAGYIDTLEMTASNEKGSGDDLERGEKLYREHCARCHGAGGEGNAEEFVPRIQAQHYSYLVRQFEWIRDGRRRNANAEMVAQIAEFSEDEMRAVLDYVSRLEPPEALRAPPDWHNPDFAVMEQDDGGGR